MIKDAALWVRLCWVSASRLWILAMKVCLLAQVTAIPSISFSSLQKTIVSNDVNCEFRVYFILMFFRNVPSEGLLADLSTEVRYLQ